MARKGLDWASDQQICIFPLQHHYGCHCLYYYLLTDHLPQLECKLLESKDKEQSLFYSLIYAKCLSPSLVCRRGSVDIYPIERGRQVWNETGQDWRYIQNLGIKNTQQFNYLDHQTGLFLTSQSLCLFRVIMLERQITRIYKKRKQADIKTKNRGQNGGNLIHFSKHVLTTSQALWRLR